MKFFSATDTRISTNILLIMPINHFQSDDYINKKIFVNICASVAKKVEATII